MISAECLLHLTDCFFEVNRTAETEGRTIVIGDVHGCIRELELLLRKLDVKKDHLVFLGDLIDKGPDSAAVVHLVNDLSDSNKVTFIVGNHEDKFLRYIARKKREQWTSVDERFGSFEILLDRLDDRHIDFLLDGFLIKRITSLGLTATHGGICSNVQLPNSIDIRYKDQQKRKNHHLLTMTRKVDMQGEFQGIQSKKTSQRFWAENYNGAFGQVVFGHQPFDEIKKFPNAIGLDTGCVFGGSLSALIAEGGQIHFEQVKSLKEYATYGYGKRL